MKGGEDNRSAKDRMIHKTAALGPAIVSEAQEYDDEEGNDHKVCKAKHIGFTFLESSF